MKKLFIYSLLFTCIPLSIITASQINDVIAKYENGNPKIIHVFQQVSNNYHLQEKRFYYDNGNIKAIGYLTGFRGGKWDYFDITGDKSQTEIDLNNMNKNKSSFELEKRIINLEKNDKINSALAVYEAHIDSVDIAFEKIILNIEQLEEVLNQKIDRVKDDVRNLEDSFETFKRSTKRTERDMKQKISTIQDDINTLNATVFPPAEEQEKEKWN